MPTLTAPVLCSCGCGEPTNAVVIKAERLVRENGETYRRAAEKLGVSYAYIKTIRRKPPKWKKGHNHAADAERRTCLICKRPFFTSHPTEQVCASGHCRIARWQQGIIERTERMAEHSRQMRAQSGPLYERQMQRIEGTRRFLAKRTMVFLDAPLRGGRINAKNIDEVTAGHLIKSGGSDDPVADEVLAFDRPRPSDLFRLGRLAPIVPEDFYQRCLDGDIRIVVDDDGVRFVQLRKGPRDLVPWFDPGYAIPGQLSGSTGKKSSRHRGRNSRSAAARGKRSSSSQPKGHR